MLKSQELPYHRPYASGNKLGSDVYGIEVPRILNALAKEKWYAMEPKLRVGSPFQFLMVCPSLGGRGRERLHGHECMRWKGVISRLTFLLS